MAKKAKTEWASGLDPKQVIWCAALHFGIGVTPESIAEMGKGLTPEMIRRASVQCVIAADKIARGFDIDPSPQLRRELVKVEAETTRTKRGTQRLTSAQRKAKASETMKKSWARRKKAEKKALMPSIKRAARKAKIAAKTPTPLPISEREAS